MVLFADELFTEFEANSNHTDDQLLQLAIENEGILFTVDKRLKERGMKNKIPIPPTKSI